MCTHLLYEPLLVVGERPAVVGHSYPDNVRNRTTWGTTSEYIQPEEQVPQVPSQRRA